MKARTRQRGPALWIPALTGALTLVLGSGCADPFVDRTAGAEDRPGASAAAPGLVHLRPYYLPAAGHLTLFTCRWPDGATIPVELPANATAAERGKLEKVLAAWQGAGLGVRFDLRPLEGVGIAIEFPDGLFAYDAGAVVDCAVEAGEIGPDAERLSARLVTARVSLARDDLRLAGSALHELGHALGFQGHAPPGRKRKRGKGASGGTVMRRDTRFLRVAGERVLDGKPFHDPSLSALYRLPSGTILRRGELSRERTGPVDRMLVLGRERGLVGPLVRVGDEEGRVAWVDPSTGRVARFLLRGLEQALKDPARLEIEPSLRARALLGEP